VIARVRPAEYLPVVRTTLCLLLAAAALVLAGCGGGGGSEASGDTTGTTTTETTTTETTEVVTTETEEGAPEAPDTAICREVASTSSELNIAASNGDFATVVKRYNVLLPEFPASLQPQVKTLIKGYEKIVADPNQYGVLDTSPYQEARAAVDAYTAKNCGN
jgi:hypothetical protein